MVAFPDAFTVTFERAATKSRKGSMETSEAELKALMIASLAGEAGAYRALLGDLRLRLGGYFSRRLRRDPHDVEDLVQDTLIAIHTRRETWDRAQGLTPWVYAIARYKLIDHYRRSGRRAFTPLDDAFMELRVEDESAAVGARKDVETALASLPERTRLLLRSLKIEELSVAETAARSGMSEGAVKVAAHRGLRTLIDRFAPGGGGGHD
jgi:RNA polymerase sigma-70 factor (ECF subfamily)